jgi:hypothetical protein
MILLSRQERLRRTDGNIRQAVWQPAGLCISLFRSHGDSGIPAITDPGGTYCAFLPRRSGSVPHHQRCSVAKDHRIQAMGRSVCSEPSDSHGMGAERVAKRRLCPALLAANAAPQTVWSVFHSSEHGAGLQLSIAQSEVCPRGSELSANPQAPCTIYAPLLLHSG